jgi:hypothetical protein
MGTPGMEATKRGRTFFHSKSFLSPMSRRTAENKPWRATRGMTVLISRKIANKGRARSMEPKPDRPWIKPAIKVIRTMRIYSLTNPADP